MSVQYANIQALNQKIENEYKFLFMPQSTHLDIKINNKLDIAVMITGKAEMALLQRLNILLGIEELSECIHGIKLMDQLFFCKLNSDKYKAQKNILTQHLLSLKPENAKTIKNLPRDFIYKILKVLNTKKGSIFYM